MLTWHWNGNVNFEQFICIYAAGRRRFEWYWILDFEIIRSLDSNKCFYSKCYVIEVQFPEKRLLSSFPFGIDRCYWPENRRHLNFAILLETPEYISLNDFGKTDHFAEKPTLMKDVNEKFWTRQIWYTLYKEQFI